MPSIQEIEIQKYHDELVSDVKSLVEKYRRIMDWDIPENDDRESDRIIFAAIQKALDAIKADS